MSWTFVVLALVLFLFAIYIGFLCGQWACEKRVITKRDYWIANFAGAAAVVLLTWVFSLFPGAVCADRLARRFYRRP